MSDMEILCNIWRRIINTDSLSFSYVRRTGQEELLVVCNFYGNEVPFAFQEEWKREGKLLLTNYTAPAEGLLRPYEAAIYHRTMKN